MESPLQCWTSIVFRGTTMAEQTLAPNPLRKSRVRKKKTRRLPLGVVESKIRDDDGNVVATRWDVRVRYEGKDGKRHAVWGKCAKNATDAGDVRKQLLRDLVRMGSEEISHARDTFKDLYEFYKTRYLIEAEYVDGRKVSGRRSLASAQSNADLLVSIMGGIKIRNIDYEVLRDIKSTLIRLPTKPTKNKWPEGRPRSIVSVNRVLQLLRHMLNVAVRKRWMDRNPFGDGDPLINAADERMRKRLMSYDEEGRIYAAAATTKRKRVPLAVMALVDTCMRSAECFRLRVRDLAFDPRQIAVEEMNTKTLTARSAPISRRLALAMQKHFLENDLGPDDFVFDFKSIKKAWWATCADAGVEDLRLKDLRRTGATRLVRGTADGRRLPIEEVSRILGHTSIKMTYVYIGVDSATTERAADILDAVHLEQAASDVIH